jgi:PAS domain S-box-containing protein
VHQKKVEKQLAISQKKYKDICLFTGDMVFELDADLKTVNITGKVKETYGRNPTEVIGHKPFDFIDTKEIERVKIALDDAIRNRTTFNFVVSDTRDGKTYYRNVIGKPFFSPDTDNFSGIRGVSKDITEKIELQNSIDEQMWLFQSAIDSITEMAVVITDKENRVLKWNAAYPKLFGYPTELLETRDPLKYFTYLKDNNMLADYDDVMKGLTDTLNSKDETVHEFSLKDGRTIRRRSKPFYKDGEFAGLVSFVQDITKDKRKTD